MDSGAVHAEAGVGVEASGYCDLRLVELKVPGGSTRLRSHGPAAGSGTVCMWKDSEFRPLSRGLALRKSRAGD